MTTTTTLSATDFLTVVDALNERLLQCQQYHDANKCEELRLLRLLLRQQVGSMAAADRRVDQETRERYDERFVDNVVEQHDQQDALLKRKMQRHFAKKVTVVANIGKIVDSVGTLRRLFQLVEDDTRAVRHMRQKLVGQPELFDSLAELTQSMVQRTRQNVLQAYYSPLELAVLEQLVQDPSGRIAIPVQVWSRRLLLFSEGKLSSERMSSVQLLQRVNAVLSRSELPLVNKASHVEALLDQQQLSSAAGSENVLLRHELASLQQQIVNPKESPKKLVDPQEFLNSRRIAPAVKLLRLLQSVQNAGRRLDKCRRAARALAAMIDECEQLGCALHRQLCVMVCRHVTSFHSESLVDVNEGVVEDLALSLQQHVVPRLEPLKAAAAEFNKLRLFLSRWREQHNTVQRLERYAGDYRDVLASFCGDFTGAKPKPQRPLPGDNDMLQTLPQLLEQTKGDALEPQLVRLYACWERWPRMPDIERQAYDRGKIDTILNERIVVGNDMPARNLAALRRVVARLKEKPELRVSHSGLFHGQVLRVYGAGTISDVELFLELFQPVVVKCMQVLNVQAEMNAKPKSHNNKTEPKSDNSKSEPKSDNNKTEPKSDKEPDKKAEAKPPPKNDEQPQPPTKEGTTGEPNKAETEGAEQDKQLEQQQQQQQREDNEEEAEVQAQDLLEPYMDARRTLLLLMSVALYLDAKYSLSEPPHLLNLAPIKDRLLRSSLQADGDASLHPSSRQLSEQLRIVDSAAERALAKLNQTAHVLLHMYNVCHSVANNGAQSVSERVAFAVDDTDAEQAAARCQWLQLSLDCTLMPRSSKYLRVVLAMNDSLAAFLQSRQLMTVVALQSVLLPLVTSAGRDSLWASWLARKMLQQLELRQHVELAMYRRYAEGVLDAALGPDLAVRPAVPERRGAMLLQQALAQGDFAVALLALVLDDYRGVGQRLDGVASMTDVEPAAGEDAVGHGWLFVPLAWACMNPEQDNRSAVVDSVNWAWVAHSYPPLYSSGVRTTRPVMMALFESLKQLRSRAATLQSYLEWVMAQQPQPQPLLQVGVNWQLVTLEERAFVWLYAMYCCVCRLSCKLLNFCGQPPQSFRVWLHTSFVSPDVRNELQDDFVFDQ